VHVINEVHDGSSYVGLKFRCTWHEYDCGVMTHLDRVVAVGPAYTSFTMPRDTGKS
jgi:hypothetical protein